MTESLRELLSTQSEHETVEFKEAKNSFSVMGKKGRQKHSVCGYVSALANEGGGKLVLGVTNDINDIREAFPELKAKDVSNLLQDLRREKKCRCLGRSVKGIWKI